MRSIFAFIVFQISFLSILSGQKDSVEFIYRDWYASGYGNKDLAINDIITFDTAKLDIKDNSNFIKWDFKRNGEFINLNVSVRKNFGNSDGESVMAMSDDNLKWEIKKGSTDLIIDYGNIEGYGNYKSKFKILCLNKSKLIVRKLNKMQCAKVN